MSTFGRLPAASETALKHAPAPKPVARGPPLLMVPLPPNATRVRRPVPASAAIGPTEAAGATTGSSSQRSLEALGRAAGGGSGRGGGDESAVGASDSDFFFGGSFGGGIGGSAAGGGAASFF